MYVYSSSVVCFMLRSRMDSINGSKFFCCCQLSF